MKLNCYLVDDAPAPMTLLARLIELVPELNLIGAEQDPEKAFSFLLQHPDCVDVVFLDIEMPGLSGLDIARSISDKMMKVFTTGHRDLGPEAYELNAVDYLLKPVTLPRLKRCVELLQQRVGSFSDTAKAEELSYLFIPGNGKGALHRLEKNAILYVQSDKSYVQIFMPGKQYYSYVTIKAMEESLPETQFVRVHRSYLVNMNYISKIDAFTITMSDNTVIPIGASYKESFMIRVNAARPQQQL